MLIGSRQRIRTFDSFLATLVIKETPIKRVDCAKSLGLNIDENLSWSKHIDKILKKIASGIGALKRMRPFVPVSTRISITQLFNHILTTVVLSGTTAPNPLQISYKIAKSCSENIDFL